MLDPLERRFAEFRVEGDAITGPLMVYGDRAAFGDWRETFEPGSLTIGDDVIVNLQHDRAKPVARTGAGLAIADDATALRATVNPPDTVYGREARELVKAGILRGFSIEFRAQDDRWEDKTRIVKRAELVGFALVDRPAYPASTIAVRFRELYAAVAPRPKRYWY